MEIKQDFESFMYVKSAFNLVKRYWYLFTASLIFFVGIALFLNWYLPPTYEVGAVMLINENQNTNALDPSKDFMKSFSIFTPISDIQREILKMKSSDLIYKALVKTHAELSYYLDQGIRKKELYTDCPFYTELDTSHVQPLNIHFTIKIKNQESFVLEIEKNKGALALYNLNRNEKTFSNKEVSLVRECRFGEIIASDIFSFKIFLRPEKVKNFPSDAKIYFKINDLNLLTYTYKKSVNIEQIAKDLQAANIKMKTENPQKGIDFINALTASYIQRNIEKKNIIAENTIQYFDNQLLVIEDSLKIAEGNLQRFRSENKVMEIAQKSDQIFKRAQELENEKEALEAIDKQYQYIQKNLETDKDGSNLSVPSSLGLNDPVLNGILEEYIKLNAEKNNLVQNKENKSPYFNILTVKINNQKKTLEENIKYLLNTNNLKLASIEKQLKTENNKISDLPGTQRKLGGIERKHKLNDNIYTYILEKKAEAQVAKASNLPDNDILESARLLQPKAVSPNTTLNLISSIILGLVFPFLGFGIKGFMNTTITDEKMVQSLTNIPTLGQVYHSHKKASMADDPRSAMSESIRTLRANLDYHFDGMRNKVILLTSSNSGEGKSFTSFNIAVSLAMLERKVILVDFDLRKPHLHNLLKSENKIGVSAVLEGSLSLEAAITQTPHQHMDFIAAGHLRPNPNELISSERTSDFIAALKKKYDYVILDTPPVGLVSEAFLLMRHADLKIIVARQAVTSKKALSVLMRELEVKQIKNIVWLLNDVSVQNTMYAKNNEYFNV